MGGAILVSSPGDYSEVFPGLEGVEYELDISYQYTTNEITITAGGDGWIEVKAKPVKGGSFEVVDNGIIDVTYSSTVTIKDCQIKALSFTQNRTAAFTVSVTQRDTARTSAP